MAMMRPFDLQLDTLELGVVNERLEAKRQRIRVDTGHLANFHTHCHDPGLRPSLRMVSYLVHYRICYSKFVHVKRTPLFVDL
jgi:hypothetical protein